MAMTPPVSLSEVAVCLQITHPPNTLSLGSNSFLVPFRQECRNGLDLQHRTLEITLNQIITSSRQRLLFTKKIKGFESLRLLSFLQKEKPLEYSVGLGYCYSCSAILH